MKAKEAVKSVYGDTQNAFTPTIEEYGWILKGIFAYELSTGFNYKPVSSRESYHLAGVSVVVAAEDEEFKKAINTSKCFTGKTKEEAVKKARKYIDKIKKDTNNEGE